MATETLFLSAWRLLLTDAEWLCLLTSVDDDNSRAWQDALVLGSVPVLRQTPPQGVFPSVDFGYAFIYFSTGNLKIIFKMFIYFFIFFELVPPPHVWWDELQQGRVTECWISSDREADEWIKVCELDLGRSGCSVVWSFIGVKSILYLLQ